MANQIFTFDEASIRRVAAAVKTIERAPRNTITRNTQRPTAYKYTRLAKLKTALAAGSGETATATKMRWSEEEEDWVNGTSPEDDFEVVNFFTALSGTVGMRCFVENQFGKWVVRDLDCEAEEDEEE